MQIAWRKKPGERVIPEKCGAGDIRVAINEPIDGSCAKTNIGIRDDQNLTVAFRSRAIDRRSVADVLIGSDEDFGLRPKSFCFTNVD
ncbi:MAG TPA: hypothetical protein VJ032_05120, partial [Thermoanaerobaculia bacterium]|nr:hypothetical protein [Thermoanaerobaculia bacterium]